MKAIEFLKQLDYNGLTAGKDWSIMTTPKDLNAEETEAWVYEQTGATIKEGKLKDGTTYGYVYGTSYGTQISRMIAIDAILEEEGESKATIYFYKLY